MTLLFSISSPTLYTSLSTRRQSPSSETKKRIFFGTQSIETAVLLDDMLKTCFIITMSLDCIYFLGTWVTFSAPISEEIAEDIIVMAFESGINVFDLSDGYCGPRAEVSLGRILKQRRWRRSSYVVMTKIYWSYR